MEDHIFIREAKPRDAATITQILSLGFAEFTNQYTPEAMEATVIPPEEVLTRMKTGKAWIAWLNHEPVGTISGKIKDQALYIQGLAVTPPGRGKRIGYLLLERVEDYATQMNCQHLLLSTTPYLTKAIRLYQKLGYSVINQPPYDLFRTPLFTMKKTLE